MQVLSAVWPHWSLLPLALLVHKACLYPVATGVGHGTDNREASPHLAPLVVQLLVLH